MQTSLRLDPRAAQALLSAKVLQANGNDPLWIDQLANQEVRILGKLAFSRGAVLFQKLQSQRAEIPVGAEAFEGDLVVPGILEVRALVIS